MAVSLPNNYSILRGAFSFAEVCMIQKICARCGKPYFGHECKACSAKRAKRYNEFDRDQVKNSVYTRREWKAAKRYVLARDKGICRMCYSINPNKVLQDSVLTVHHIVPVEDDSSLWYDHNNLITVCSKHHQEIHGRYNAGIREKARMQSRLKAMFAWD